MRCRNQLFKAVLSCLFLLMSGTVSSWAHETDHVSARAVFERNGDYLIELVLKIVESADPALNDEISPEEAALSYLKEAIALKIDEEEFRPEFSELKRADVEVSEGETILYTQVEGTVPNGADLFFVRVLPTAQVAVWMIVIKDGKPDRRSHVMYPGEYSKPIDLRFMTDEIIYADPFAAAPSFKDGAWAGMAGLVFGPSPPTAKEGVSLPGRGGHAAVLLFTILLFGLNLRQSIEQLATVMVAALLGHSIAMQFDLRIPDGLAELVLGVAVLGIAVDNLMRNRWGWGRHAPIAVAAILAGACSRQIMFETEGAALSGFYFGGAVAVAAVFIAFWLAASTFWKRPWYRHQLIIPCSFLVAGIGAFWVFSATISFF
ncbi:MAG: hypothetical protein ACI8UO_002436 [Verrucomicrobiales bacterium]